MCSCVLVIKDWHHQVESLSLAISSRLLLILNIPSSKIYECIGKQYPGCKERLLLSAALGTGLGKELRDSWLKAGWRMILDQIREVPLTHRYSCPGILNSNRWLSTKGIIAKEQEAELDVVMIPLLKKRFPSSCAKGERKTKKTKRGRCSKRG